MRKKNPKNVFHLRRHNEDQLIGGEQLVGIPLIPFSEKILVSTKQNKTRISN